jgi:hypothetical protein
MNTPLLITMFLAGCTSEEETSLEKDFASLGHAASTAHYADILKEKENIDIVILSYPTDGLLSEYTFEKIVALSDAGISIAFFKKNSWTLHIPNGFTTLPEKDRNTWKYGKPVFPRIGGTNAK